MLIRIVIITNIQYQIPFPIEKMATLVTDEVSVQYLTNLKEQLSLFMNRTKIEIEQGNLRELGESFLQEINNRFHNENQIIKNIALKWNDFINSWINIKQEHELQVHDLNEEIQEKSIEIYNLEEIVSHLEAKVGRYEEQYDKLKADLLLVSEKTEKLEAECTSYKLLLTKNQKQAVETAEKDRNIISTMINEKEILLDQIKDERKVNSEIKQEIIQLEMRMEQYVRQGKITDNNLEESLRYNKQLQNILNQKNDAIAQLQNEIKLKDYQQSVAYTPFFQLQNRENSPDPQIAQEDSSISIKLEDEIPYEEPFAFQFHRRLSQLNLNPNRLLDDEPMQSTALKMNMDPYFAHFVLTSQSVKIKQDCQQLLNIDAKPFYLQIVQKRIPMHLWDQWIRNKLKQVLKMRKAESSDNSEEE